MANKHFSLVSVVTLALNQGHNTFTSILTIRPAGINTSCFTDPSSLAEVKSGGCAGECLSGTIDLCIQQRDLNVATLIWWKCQSQHYIYSFISCNYLSFYCIVHFCQKGIKNSLTIAINAKSGQQENSANIWSLILMSFIILFQPY